jgi:putative oxidoreductase
MQGYARQQGAPAPTVTVPLTGVVIISSGLAVMLGVLADLAALLIAGFLFLTAFIIHRFWTVQDPQMRQMEQVQFSKDLALAGAALLMFYAWNQLQGDAGLSITDPLFGSGD